jgi:hypothetical protein
MTGQTIRSRAYQRRDDEEGNGATGKRRFSIMVAPHPALIGVSRFISEESRAGTPDTSGLLASPSRRITSAGYRRLGRLAHQNGGC